jgi:hypothetical protein
MSKDNIIEFVEVEYRPLVSDQATALQLPQLQKKTPAKVLRKRPSSITRLRRDEVDDIELVTLPTRETGNVSSKVPGMKATGRVFENDERIEHVPRVVAVSFV